MNRSIEDLWAETFVYARQRSPFYRELFGRRRGVPRIEDLPTVDKKILSERNLDFLCVPRDKIVEIVTTSGTTGKPLLWMMTRADTRRLALNEKESFECAGMTARDTVLVAVALDRCFVAGLAYCSGLHELGCAVVRTGPSSPMLVLEMIQRVQPTGIVAVPSFLRVIAEKAREKGFDLKQSSVKKAVCIGEPVRNRAFELNRAGRAIEVSWGARVYATYGVTELANSLCECAAGAGGHLHGRQLYIEILDDAGNAVPSGEVGEVVATTFGVEGMPLIRYRTGDCAALFSGACVCGRKTSRLGPILGRKNQKLKLKGTSLFPSTLAAAMEETGAVEDFVIIARAENELSDAVEVLFHGPASVADVREILQARAKIAPLVRRVSAAKIAAWQMPVETHKRRAFVDLR